MKANYYISAADDVKSDKPARKNGKNDKSKNKLRNRNRDTRSSMKRKIGRRGRR